MSHERSTPSSPGSEEFASSPPPPSSPQQFAHSPSGFARHYVPPTALERFAMGRGESTCQAMAGAAGGFMSGVVTCPLDVIKTKLQAQGGFRAQNGNRPPAGASSVVYRGMLGTARVIWREEGLKGMYRGLGPIILGYLPTWAVWFTVYGKSKTYFSKHSGMFIKQIWRWSMANILPRKRKRRQLLVINCGRIIFYYGHKPDLPGIIDLR
jgi:solute carrier family 25 folate transporter 32